MAAWELTHNGRTGVRKGIIFETDGQPNAAVGPGPNYCALASAAATAAKAQNIEIFTIGFGLDAASGGDPACPDTSGAWKGKTATALLDNMATQPKVGTTTCDDTENNDDDHFYCIGKTGASTDLSKIFKAAAIAAGQGQVAPRQPLSDPGGHGGQPVERLAQRRDDRDDLRLVLHRRDDGHLQWRVGPLHRGQRHDDHRDGTVRRDRHDGRHLRDDTGRDHQPGQRGPLHLHLIRGHARRRAALTTCLYSRPCSLARPASATGTRHHGSCSWTTTAGLLVPLAEQLRLDGFDVTTARDGEEALRRLDTAWPDLLIIDLLMPRMDGLTLAREIKARADLPIIVLSAIDAGDNKADLLDEFAEDYITKPYHYSELRARIQRVLRRVGERVPRKGLDLGPDLDPRAPPAPGDRRAASRSS